MNIDPSIREQTYPYFLQEAPELLHALEQGLLNLRENWGISQVNDLMRATHTLKGAATSIGLETIARIAHSFEDVFKALCQPNTSLDPDVEALLFEGLECLRLPLMAELTGSAIDQAEVLNRTATIFALLQEKLGDCFAQDAYLPTSAELGFDLTQSLFEVGVTQRLEQIAASLNEADPESVAIVLRTQAEVLLGLAESLNLSGFAAIAKATIAALDQHPEQAVTIAEIALADFQAGQTAVFAGDRIQGGEPSEELQQLAGLTLLDFEADSSLEESNSLLESIWGEVATSVDTIPQIPVEEPARSDVDDQQSCELVLPVPASNQHQKPSTSPSPSVRVSLQHLDQLNYSVGELITYQNRQSLQAEQLRAVSKKLLNQIDRHQQLLAQLQYQTSRQANQQSAENRSTSHSKSSNRAARRARKSRPANPLSKEETSSSLTQSLLDHTVQLSETAAAVDLLTDQATQLLEKQQQLLTSTQSALIEARMLPLSEIFGRFPNTLQQLETLHNKPIALKLKGAEVLVDKAVAEKLFDPLLHLVRNAFDHGIEPTAIRQQRGKPEKGQITLSAYHQGRHLVIEVQDDGNGLEFDQIRTRAIDRQLLSIDQATLLTQEQLANLLFEPGFSTASQVSDLSGRGIGLDVVRSQLNALCGSVTVRSMPQQGTTFTLQIPLNLTIAQLLVCEVGSKTYALLDDAVEQILIPRANQIQERNGGKFLHWSQGSNETLIPIFSLTQLLTYQSATPAPQSPSFAVSNDLANPVILIHCQDHLLGLTVDRLMSEQKLVIRPLGTRLESPDYVHGASTLADGRLALVIDPAMLLQKKIVPTPVPATSSHWATNLLPTSNQALLAQPELPFSGSAPAISPRSSTRILVIDDSITARQSLVFVLEKMGYQVFQAQDGQEGLDWFQHHANIQLVVCDIDMPRMNGFEFLRQRQQIPALAAVPVLMLSSQSDEKHQLLASQLGANAYMVKPFMEPRLLAIVTRLLEQAALTAMAE